MTVWKYTIPITRAYELDGSLLLEGEASGPERDTFNTRMLPEAIEDFERQIMERASSGNPLPYYDSHSKIRTRDGGIQPKGALAELGVVIMARVNEAGRLFVRAELDPENPAAVFIHRKAAQGKRYGMSVAGDASPTDILVEKDESGRRTVAFKRVVLNEISNTTAPSWVPSLGTVIARSLDADEAEEETPMTEVAKTEETAAPETETTAETTVVENEEVTAPAAEAVAETTETTTERETETTTSETEVERARMSKKDTETVITAFKALAETLGVDLKDLTAVEAPVTETAPETPARSETGDTVDFGGHAVDRVVAEAITAFVGEKLTEAAGVIERQAEYIKKLEDMPAGKVPATVVREKFENPLEEITRIEDADERLHAALNALYVNHL